MSTTSWSAHYSGVWTEQCCALSGNWSKRYAHRGSASAPFVWQVPVPPPKENPPPKLNHKLFLPQSQSRLGSLGHNWAVFVGSVWVESALTVAFTNGLWRCQTKSKRRMQLLSLWSILACCCCFCFFVFLFFLFTESSYSMSVNSQN